MKITKRNLFILLCSFFIVGCNQLQEGIVISKIHEEADKQLILVPTHIGKVQIIQQHWIYDDEDWILTIKANKGSKYIHKNVYVTKECYEALKIGDYWKKTNYCSFTDNNNKTVRIK